MRLLNRYEGLLFSFFCFDLIKKLLYNIFFFVQNTIFVFLFAHIIIGLFTLNVSACSFFYHGETLLDGAEMLARPLCDPSCCCRLTVLLDPVDSMVSLETEDAVLFTQVIKKPTTTSLFFSFLSCVFVLAMALSCVQPVFMLISCINLTWSEFPDWCEKQNSYYDLLVGYCTRVLAHKSFATFFFEQLKELRKILRRFFFILSVGAVDARTKVFWKFVAWTFFLTVITFLLLVLYPIRRVLLLLVIVILDKFNYFLWEPFFKLYRTLMLKSDRTTIVKVFDSNSNLVVLSRLYFVFSSIVSSYTTIMVTQIAEQLLYFHIDDFVVYKIVIVIWILAYMMIRFFCKRFL